MRPELEPWRPTDKASAAKLNTLLRELQRVDNITVSHPLELIRGAAGIHIRLKILSTWTDRWGILTADLVGGTTTPVLANAFVFDRNSADSGSHGSWIAELNQGGTQETFKVIAPLLKILPVTKKLLAGTAVHCEQVAYDVWAPDASECPVNV